MRSERAGDGQARMRCPKCGLAQASASACRGCGLVAARFDAFAAGAEAEAAAEAEQGPEPALDALWRGVEASWADVALHDRFVEAASAAGAFAYAARRYRDAVRKRPDDPEAVRQLARVGRMAEAALMASAGPPAKISVYEPYKKRAMLLFLLLLFVLGAGATAWVYLVAHTAAPLPWPAGGAAASSARERPSRPPLPRRTHPAAGRHVVPSSAPTP